MGVDAADGAAIDDAVAALWKAADAGKLRVVAIGGKPRKIVRLDPEDLKEVPSSEAHAVAISICCARAIGYTSRSPNGLDWISR